MGTGKISGASVPERGVARHSVETAKVALNGAPLDRVTSAWVDALHMGGKFLKAWANAADTFGDVVGAVGRGLDDFEKRHKAAEREEEERTMRLKMQQYLNNQAMGSDEHV